MIRRRRRAPRAPLSLVTALLTCAVVAGAGLLATGLAVGVATPAAAASQELGSCRFHLPRNTWTIAYGVYTGSLPSKVKFLPSHGSHNIKRVEVTVPKKDVPLFLVMTAYDPVEWDLHITPGTNIAGVLVMGYHNQVVRNLPTNVPLGFSTRNDGAGDQCPREARYAYGSGDDYSNLYALIGDEFSRKINEFHGRYGAECLPKGCVVTKPAPKGIWNILLGPTPKPEDKPAADAPPLRASARLVE